MPPSAKLTGLPNGYPAIEACVEIVDIVPQVMLRTIQRAYAAWSPTAGTGTPVWGRVLLERARGRHSFSGTNVPTK